MNIQELAESAGYMINKNMDDIILKLPKRQKVREKRFLAGHNSPLGDLLAVEKDYEVISFVALDVLAWCVAHGAEIQIGVRD